LSTSADVLILGCGPAGLMAAQAVWSMGGLPHIVSIKVKSELQGAQYLHEPIPGVTGAPDGVITTLRRGTREGYATKVYGDPTLPCSWDDQVEEREVWDLRRAYQTLWDRYQSFIIDAEIKRRNLAEFAHNWPLVISTIPATRLCAPAWGRMMEGLDHHEFGWKSMYTIDYASHEVADNTVLYSGAPEHSWYRASRVFGYASTEWTAPPQMFGGAYLTPERDLPRIFPLKKGIKVMGTTCDCFPKIKRAGRFGTWRKGYLTHHAYADALRYYTETFGG
jgi:hypothetical protein